MVELQDLFDPGRPLPPMYDGAFRSRLEAAARTPFQARRVSGSVAPARRERSPFAPPASDDGFADPAGGPSLEDLAFGALDGGTAAGIVAGGVGGGGAPVFPARSPGTRPSDGPSPRPPGRPPLRPEPVAARATGNLPARPRRRDANPGNGGGRGGSGGAGGGGGSPPAPPPLGAPRSPRPPAPTDTPSTPGRSPAARPGAGTDRAVIGGRAASTTRTPTDPAFLHRVLGLFGLHRLIDRATESAGQLNRRNPEGFDKTVAGVQSEVLRRLPPDTPPAVQNAVRVTCAQCRDARRPGIVAERNGAIADELRTQADTRDREAIAALAAGDATRAATLKNEALGLRAAADRIVPKPGPVEDARGTAKTVGPYGDGNGDAPDGDDDRPRVVLAADKGGRSSGDQGDGAPNEMGRRKRLAQYVHKYKRDHRLRPAEEVRALRRDIYQLFNRARNLKEREFLKQADALGLLPDRARLMYRIAKSDGSNLAELRRSIHREYGDGLYGKHLIEALEISLARGGPDEFLLIHGRTAHPEFVQFLDEFGITDSIVGAINPGRALRRLARETSRRKRGHNTARKGLGEHKDAPFANKRDETKRASIQGRETVERTNRRVAGQSDGRQVYVHRANRLDNAESGTVLHTAKGDVISKEVMRTGRPLGFSQAHIETMHRTVIPALRKIDPNASIGMRGSSIHGSKFNPGSGAHDGPKFDPSKSDVDLYIVSPKLIEAIRANPDFVTAVRKSGRSQPLSVGADKELWQEFGLNTFAETLANQFPGRKISIMIYGGVDAVSSRGTHLQFK